MSDYTYSYEETRRFVAYQCPICGREFPTRRTAERHLTACQQTEADAEAMREAGETFTQLVQAGATRRTGTAT